MATKTNKRKGKMKMNQKIKGTGRKIKKQIGKSTRKIKDSTSKEWNKVKKGAGNVLKRKKRS